MNQRRYKETGLGKLLNAGSVLYRYYLVCLAALYGNNDTWYDVSEMGYEEGTWLYLYINPDTKLLEYTRPMNEVNAEQGARESELITRALFVFGAGMIVLIVGLILALGVFETPFRKWVKEYRGNRL